MRSGVGWTIMTHRPHSSLDNLTPTAFAKLGRWLSLGPQPLSKPNDTEEFVHRLDQRWGADQDRLGFTEELQVKT